MCLINCKIPKESLINWLHRECKRALSVLCTVLNAAVAAICDLFIYLFLLLILFICCCVLICCYSTRSLWAIICLALFCISPHFASNAFNYFVLLALYVRIMRFPPHLAGRFAADSVRLRARNLHFKYDLSCALALADQTKETRQCEMCHSTHAHRPTYGHAHTTMGGRNKIIFENYFEYLPVRWRWKCAFIKSECAQRTWNNLMNLNSNRILNYVCSIILYTGPMPISPLLAR